jgi:hypothetical protein
MAWTRTPLLPNRIHSSGHARSPPERRPGLPESRARLPDTRCGLPDGRSFRGRQGTSARGNADVQGWTGEHDTKWTSALACRPVVHRGRRGRSWLHGTADGLGAANVGTLERRQSPRPSRARAPPRHPKGRPFPEGGRRRRPRRSMDAVHVPVWIASQPTTTHPTRCPCDGREAAHCVAGDTKPPALPWDRGGMPGRNGCESSGEPGNGPDCGDARPNTIPRVGSGDDPVA